MWLWFSHFDTKHLYCWRTQLFMTELVIFYVYWCDQPLVLLLSPTSDIMMSHRSYSRVPLLAPRSHWFLSIIWQIPLGPHVLNHTRSLWYHLMTHLAKYINVFNKAWKITHVLSYSLHTRCCFHNTVCQCVRAAVQHSIDIHSRIPHSCSLSSSMVSVTFPLVLEACGEAAWWGADSRTELLGDDFLLEKLMLREPVRLGPLLSPRPPCRADITLPNRLWFRCKTESTDWVKL